MIEEGFGYPSACELCKGPSVSSVNLQVKPFYQAGNDFRLMLIGQDPTVRRKPERVKHVLMLDEPNGQLSRWLRSLFGEDTFREITIYATNIVKCNFDKPPSEFDGGGLKFLKPYFDNCKQYLYEEVSNYKPTLVLSLGEPAHNLFTTFLGIPDYPDRMKEAFTGEFISCDIDGHTFDYSPCLHIQTWRVAETYGDRVKKFQRGISSYFFEKDKS